MILCQFQAEEEAEHDFKEATDDMDHEAGFMDQGIDMG